MAAVMEAPGAASRTPAWTVPVLLLIGMVALALASFAVGRVTGDGGMSSGDMVRMHDSMQQMHESMPMSGSMPGSTPMLTTTTAP